MHWQPTDTDIDAFKQWITVDTSWHHLTLLCRIFPTRKQVKEYNDQCLTLLTSSHTTLPAVYSVAAIDTKTSAPVYLTNEQIQESKPDSKSETAGLAETLKIAHHADT